MQHYWRLQDIPELRDVATHERRAQWREAVTRSYSVRGMFALFLLYLLALTGGDVVASWIGLDSAWIKYGGACLILLAVYVACDHWWIQPRARRWLQAHPVSERQARNVA